MIVMRHCQSEFNLLFSQSRKDPGIADPSLTEEGIRHAERAAAELSDLSISRILVSPYTRALQTAAPIAAQHGLKPIITPSVRERVHFSCDIGTPASQLASLWPMLDFSDLEEIWWDQNSESEATITARARQFLSDQLAQNHNSETTLIVSHWCFLKALSGTSIANGAWEHIDASALHDTWHLR